MYGDRAADAQLGLVLVGGMARLGDGLGGRVQGIGFDAQALRADGAPGNDRFIAVHKHFNGNPRADGVPGHGLPGRVENGRVQDRRCTVQGSVRTQIRNAAGSGTDKQLTGGADAFCRLHLRKVRVVNVRNAQGTHHLSRALGARGFGGLFKNLTDVGGAGDHVNRLAIHAGNAEQIGSEGQHIRGGHLIDGGLIIVGNRQRHRAGSHIGSGIHYHVVPSRDGGIAANDRLGGAEYKVPCNIHTGLGSHIPHIGDLAGGVAGAVHNTGGE